MYLQKKSSRLPSACSVQLLHVLNYDLRSGVMGFLDSNSGLMLEKSMGFLWAKQRAILDNIANAETPNYKPKVVTFEEDLKQKLELAQRSETPRHAVHDALNAAEYTVEEQMEATRMDDNGVNVTEQSAEMIRNAYQLQYVMRAISDDMTGLRTAIRGQ